MEWTRRAWLQALAAGLGWTLAPVSLAQPSMRRRAIPSSGESLPVIGMGTSRTFDAKPGGAESERLLAVLRAFFQGGGRVIDSSPMYGAAEAQLGHLLARLSVPADRFAATKVWTTGEQAGVAQMQHSAELWGLPRFDLMQIHNLLDWRVHLKTLRAWKEAGRVRYIGITTSHGRDHDELERILRTEPLDFVQFSYNLAERETERRLLPLAAERGIATLINRPYQRGYLFRRVRGLALPAWAAEFDCVSWGQLFLKFCLSHPAVTCVIPATSKPKHMRDNLQAGFGRLPDAAQRRRILDWFARL